MMTKLQNVHKKKTRTHNRKFRQRMNAIDKIEIYFLSILWFSIKIGNNNNIDAELNNYGNGIIWK